MTSLEVAQQGLKDIIAMEKKKYRTGMGYDSLVHTVAADALDGSKVLHDEEEIENLYDICDSVHSSCDFNCPVFAINGARPGADRPWKENRGCDCFQDGKAMQEFILANQK